MGVSLFFLSNTLPTGCFVRFPYISFLNLKIIIIIFKFFVFSFRYGEVESYKAFFGCESSISDMWHDLSNKKNIISSQRLYMM